MGTGSDLPLDRSALQRRSLRILVFSQVLGGAGLAAGVTVGALLAEDMIGSTRFAGLPAALFTIGSAATAFLVGVLSDRGGRRVGLAVGYFGGGLVRQLLEGPPVPVGIAEGSVQHPSEILYLAHLHLAF